MIDFLGIYLKQLYKGRQVRLGRPDPKDRLDLLDRLVMQGIFHKIQS
jgi:hypothetical protein